LGVLDPACSAGVLPLDANGVAADLHIAGLIDHQDRLVVVQVLGNVVAQVVANSISVPLGSVHQVLHAVRGWLPGPLGDGPAVLARQVCEQPEHQPLCAAPGFDPCEPACDPVHQAYNASCQRAGFTL
jgi:hypothetical protein